MGWEDLRVAACYQALRCRYRWLVANGSVLIRNNVQVTGTVSGQPMLFAHGFGCDHHMWRFVAPQFEAEHRVVVFDHVGFGGSQLSAWDPVRHRELSAYAADLLDVVAELDLTDIVYVGHSVAAMIGVLAAIAEPDRFAELVLVGPSPRYLDDPATGYVGGFSPDDITGLLTALESNYFGWSSTMAPVIMGNAERPALGRELTESFCRTDPQVAAAFAHATFLSDNRADLARLTVPTLVLQCSDDAIAPEHVGRWVADHIPQSTLVQLEATGHCPNLSAPEETTRAIAHYLNSRRAARI
jgi:sigma-B regulation protein RsbQ